MNNKTAHTSQKNADISIVIPFFFSKFVANKSRHQKYGCTTKPRPMTKPHGIKTVIQDFKAIIQGIQTVIHGFQATPYGIRTMTQQPSSAP